MDRQDLMNALRLVRDYCKSRDECGSIDICDGCLIKKECILNLATNPNEWRLDDDK